MTKFEWTDELKDWIVASSDDELQEFVNENGLKYESVSRFRRKLRGKNKEGKETDLGSLKAFLRGNKVSVTEIANHFNICPDEAVKLIKKLQEGHTLLDIVEDKVSLTSDIRVTDDSFVIDQRKATEKEFCIGFTADNHIGSKYERMDALEDLFDRFVDRGMTQVYQGGNMIDGEARFNKFDIYVHGIEDQIANFVQKWPQRDGVVTHFVTGDDHEGWYVQREHINIGQKIEDEAIRAGRTDLIHLGYMERDIEFTQPKGSSRVRVIHAGGGSSYATSYTSQKYVESLQGGEKPAVVLVGHFHKLDYAYPREVHVIQMGCTEDQTPFMRKKRLQAHVGGGVLWLTQNEYGIFTSVKVEFFTYFDRKFYEYKW